MFDGKIMLVKKGEGRLQWVPATNGEYKLEQE